MLRLCDQATDCPPDQPLDNFSSEADDSLDYIATFFYGPPPPLFRQWSSKSCGITYISNVSQIDADQQAASGAILCQFGRENPNPPPGQLFLNSPQACCVPCPDGTQTCYTIPGGLFLAINQATADSIAHNLACQLVASNRVCINQIPRCMCIGDNYSATLTSTAPVQWSFTGGSLPTGLTFAGGTGFNTLISGVPTVSGQYTFKIKGQTSVGTSTEKTFTLTVLEIVTASIPPYTIGVPYSFQLQAAGGSGHYNWKITSGTLPPGLNMSLTGLISGTPI